MADKIQLPNGAFFPVKEGESKEQALAVAQQMYPDAFAATAAPTPKQSGSGLGDIARSFGLGAVGATGALASTFGADNAAARGLAGAGESLQAGLSDKRKAELQAQAARMQAAEKSGSTWEEIKAGLLNVAEAPVQSAAQALGSFVPVVATLPLAKLGLGVRAIMAVRGAIGAAQGAGSVKQNVYEAVLKAETEEGKPPAQAQAAAVKAQEYVGANLDQILLGAGLGGVAGTTGAERLIPGGARATAGAAQQAVAKRIGERAASGVAGAAAEMPLEGLQGGQERLASNLALQRTGRDVGTFTGVAGQAAQEALTGGLGGGALGVALPDRTLSMAAAAERKKQREAEAALAEQERLAQEEKTAAEEAERNSLPYALQVGQQYDTLLQEFRTKQSALKKPGKDADPAAKAEYADAQKELQALSAQLKELVPEYRRTKAARAQAQEAARVAGMDPFDYMMEQTGTVPTYAPSKPGTLPEVDMEGIPGAASDFKTAKTERAEALAAEQERVSAVPTTYAAERVALANEQLINPTGAEYVEYLLQDPYKASLIVETRTPMPGLTASESNLIRNALAKRLKALGKEELTARQADLQAQKPSAEPVNPMAQFLADQDMLDVARQEGFTEADIAFVERQAAMPRDTIEQGDLFGKQRVGQAAGVTEQRGNIADKLDEMQRQLDIAYAQRNTERGGQYRETIRGLIEQIRDLQTRTAMPTTGELGAVTADLQGQLGQLPENLQAQRAAEAARQAALARVANKEEGARSDAVNSLVEEIKAARGALRPETITEIEKEADTILSTLERYGDQGDLLAVTQQQLDRLSQKWRSGTVRGETATRTVTPITTSPEMLREQMDRAFAQNDQSTRTERRERYAPQDMAVLNQIADNFKAFAATPDRLNMAGEWLNRLTTTGRSSPEMTRDLQAELARLEEGKLQDSGQLELPERFMPKEIEGKAPEKKSTAFATAAEFQKYLASDALKVLRQAMGMGKDTASRTHARLELFSKKVENISKQLAALQARKAALESQRKADTGTALELLRTAEDNLKKIYERLDAELADLQTEYMQARQQFDFTAQTVSDIGQKIADNLAKFQSTDTAVVEAAQKTAEAKTAYATAIEQPVNKRTFSALRKARREVITAIEKQITASRKAGADETLLAFLNADLNLQLQLQAEEKALDRDAQSLLNAGLALEEAAATQKRSRKNQKALKQAQQELAAALEIKGDVAKEAGDIDAQLAQVQTAIASAEKELNRVQNIADRTQTTRQAEAAARAEEEQKSAFQRSLDAVKIEKPTRAEQDAITARDKAERDAFQATTARLAAIPGTRIDFTKRREMLELVKAADNNFATIEQNIKDAETGIEEMQIAVAIAEDAIADTTAGYTPEQVAKFQERIKIANERITQLRSAVGNYEKQREKMQVAYDKAVVATSSDPEVYAAVTKQFEDRIAKLNKNITENEERIAGGVDKRGRPLAAKTLAQMKKRLAKYKSELRRTTGKLSNRLGITRTDVLTGEKFEGQRGRALSAEEKIQLAEAEQRKEEYERLTKEIDALKAKKQKAEAAGQPKAPAMIQARINALEAERAEVAPRAAGTVSQATRIQSAAPGKFRTGTAESKADTGVSRQPITEKRAVAQPTVTKAVEEANEFAQRLEGAKDRKTLVSDFATESAMQRFNILQAVKDNVQRYRGAVARLETERDALQASVDKAKSPEQVPVATRERLKDVRVGLESYNQMLNRAEFALADLEAAQEAPAAAPAGKAASTVKGTEMKQPKGGGMRAQDIISDIYADETFSDDDADFAALYRVSKTTGPSMGVAQVQKAYDALTADWVNKPQTLVVADEKGLPVRLLNQAKRDDMLGKIPGIYDPVSGKVYLVASNLRSVNDVILTTVHEIAGHFGLQKVLGDTYTKTMNDIYNGNAAIRKAADAKLKQVKSLKRETAVEEALAEQAELDPNAPDTRSAMRRIYDTLKKWVRDTFGFKDTITDAQVNQIIANARRFVIEGGEEGKGTAGVLTPSYRSKATAPANALEELALDITTQPKTFKEKLGSNIALQAEMNAVDMRAGLRDALRAGDDKLFTQAMYHVRKAEQKMAQMFTVMNSGPLVAYKDEKGLVGYRSSNQNSARDVFDAIADIPVDDPQKKTNIAQAYMVAQRAANKGLSKLDLGELGITEDKLKAALAAANADPTLKAALENVRRKYNAYNKGMIEFLASTGRISKKTAADLLKDGDYVPYYRVRDNGMAELNFGNNVTFNVGDIRRQPYLAELKGGQTKLLPLNEAIQQNTLLLTDMALTNNATKSVAYGLQALGKGMGPADPKTGKPGNLMPIKSGPGPADARTIRFYQEPDPNDPKDTGERHLVVNTKGTAAEGIPAEMVVQSLEGASLALPGFLKLGGVAADWLRAGVTRTPLYIARKLLREPMAAAFTGGLNSNAFSAVFKAGAEFVRMSRGTSDAQAKLIEKGLIQSNIFAGDMSDMKKMALQLASGKDQNAFDKVLAAADRYAMRADAATLALVLKNAQENGLSEVEADMMTMESMNFYKRGLSPTLQYASRLIPFFNAQIQGLNVLAKAARGNMPFEEQQQIKRKFFNNAMLLMATGIVYAMAMEDDETFRNARPRDKYANFFLPIPGVDEPLKLPIPFEAGYFYSLAVAAVDAMRAETDGKAQWSALKDLFMGSIPGYSSMGMPQIVKPAFEVWTNKNFLTGGSVEPQRMQGYTTEERYLATTTELAKQLSKAVPILSPIQIEHLVRSYFGVLPLVAVAGANSLFEREGKGEKPEARASDMPLIGSAFQKKYGGGDSDVVYREAKEAMDAKTTFNKMLKEGRREEAVAYRDENRTELTLATAAGQYRQLVGRINEDVRRTQERSDLNAQEKRIRLDKLEEAKQQAADRFLALRRKAEAATGG